RARSHTALHDAAHVVVHARSRIMFALHEGLLGEDENGASNLEGEEFLVGRLWAERLDWAYAEECGFSVLSVCDARSGTWMQVLETLTKGQGQKFRKELNLEHFVTDIIFIHEILIHPEVKDRVSLVASAIRGLSSENSLVLMYHDQSEEHHLEDWEDNDLGFKKIARSNLLLRDNHFQFPFAENHAAGRRVAFNATADHEDWVLEKWNNLVADHPSM
ncbi:MAG: hypothetical protein AAF483_26595, partial [Planctomycetota bacterium]